MRRLLKGIAYARGDGHDSVRAVQEVLPTLRATLAALGAGVGSDGILKGVLPTATVGQATASVLRRPQTSSVGPASLSLPASVDKPMQPQGTALDATALRAVRPKPRRPALQAIGTRDILPVLAAGSRLATEATSGPPRTVLCAHLSKTEPRP